MNYELAERFSPYICFDKNEPFYPVLVGVSIFEGPGKSPSTARYFDFTDKNVACIIEYAIYWNFNIQHMYELEHIWVYVDNEQEFYHAEASFHGQVFSAFLKDKLNVKEETHVVLYSQPGKHAFLPIPEMFSLIPDLYETCGANAGKDGLIVTVPFRGVYETNEKRNEMVNWYLKRFAFKPCLEFCEYHIPPQILVEWDELYKAVPARIEKELKKIDNLFQMEWWDYTYPFKKERKTKRKHVLFFDCGDTLIDENSEIRNRFGEVISARPVPGAPEILADLYEKGYRMAIVADGMSQQFKNILPQYGFDKYFESFTVSENVRAEKPDIRMFKAALGAMNLSEADAKNVVMIGNNLERDILGANLMGMISVFVKWNPDSQYAKDPRTDEERPDYTITSLADLPIILDKLETA